MGQQTLQTISNIVAILIGVCIGLALSGIPGSLHWLETWQTLITGIFAIAAAAITVLQMQRSDDRQEARHRELVQLGLRSERLKFERALGVLGMRLSQAATKLQLALDVIEPSFFSNIELSEMEDIETAVRSYKDLCAEIESVLDDEYLVEVKSLTDAPSRLLFSSLETSVHAMLNSFEVLNTRTSAIWGGLSDRRANYVPVDGWLDISSAPRRASALADALNLLAKSHALRGSFSLASVIGS